MHLRRAVLRRSVVGIERTVLIWCVCPQRGRRKIDGHIIGRIGRFTLRRGHERFRRTAFFGHGDETRSDLRLGLCLIRRRYNDFTTTLPTPRLTTGKSDFNLVVLPTLTSEGDHGFSFKR